MSSFIPCGSTLTICRLADSLKTWPHIFCLGNQRLKVLQQQQEQQAGYDKVADAPPCIVNRDIQWLVCLHINVYVCVCVSVCLCESPHSPQSIDMQTAGELVEKALITAKQNYNNKCKIIQNKTVGSHLAGRRDEFGFRLSL